MMDNSRIKIVIADDNKDFTYILKEYLGFKDSFEIVGVARNGAEAIDYVTKHDIDLLLLDIIMPVLNGIQVLEKLNSMEMKKKPRTIVFSAVSNESLTRQAIHLGAECYVIKPYDIVKLEAIIDRMFKMREAAI